MTRRDVLVVTHPLGSAGENATRTLLNILAAISPVALVTADLPEDSSIREEFEVFELTTKSAGTGPLLAAARFVFNQVRMCRTIRQRPEDVILFFGATSYILPIYYSRLSGRTVLVEPRGDVPLTLKLNWTQRLPNTVAWALAGLVRGLEVICFAAAHRIITYTPNMARELGLNPESPRVYPHGARYVDLERFAPELPFEDREQTVGFVGRISEEKGIRILADVASRMPEEMTFRFVGEGPLLGWLEDELEDDIDSGVVEVIGWVDHDDVPRELNRLRLLVMPSQPTEGLPTVILEAMACGTPVYATPVSGVRDVLTDRETGYFMDTTDPDVIVDDIKRIINSYDLADVGDAGRDFVESEYGFEDAVRRYEKLLDGL